MLTLDRSHSHHSPVPSHQHRPSAASRSSFDLPPRSRSTPPNLGSLPMSPPSSAQSGGFPGGGGQMSPQQYQAYLAAQQGGWGNGYFQGGGYPQFGSGGGSPFSQNGGMSQQQQIYQHQQQLAAWAAAYQQMMMNGGGSQQNVPFPGGSPYGANGQKDYQRPPPHLDTHRRRTSSGPQNTTHEPTYFPQPPPQHNTHHNGFQPPSFPHRQYSSSPGGSPSQRPPNLPPPQPQQRQPSPQPPSAAEQTGAGFHPYRRPDRRVAAGSSREQSTSSAASRPPQDAVIPPSRPYVRTEAPGSSSSVASNSASRTDPKRRDGDNERQRVVSPTPQAASGSAALPKGHVKANHARQSSHSSSDPSSGGSISSLGAVVPRIQTGTARRESFSSDRASIVQSGTSSPTSSSSNNNSPTTSNHRPNSPSGGNSSSKPPSKPSPLSQRQPIVREPEPVVVATPAPTASAPTPMMVKSGGLMGRLKGKLGNEDDGKKKKDLGKGKPSTPPSPWSSGSSLPTSKSPTQLRSVSSPATTTTPSTGPLTPSHFQSGAVRDDPVKASDGKGKRSMFNIKNASTDNISIASAASSASMMIRKIGNFGKLAKRNSLMGISNMFKDKKEDDLDGAPGEKKKKGGLFKSRKADASTAAVTHFSAENDRFSTSKDDQPVPGLSPAAKLARQHTLRSKAEEQAAAAARAARRGGPVAAAAVVNEEGRRPSIEVPSVWDKNTVTRNGTPVQQEEPQQAWRRDEGRPSSEDDNASFGPSDDDGHGGYDEDDEHLDDVTSRMEGAGLSDRESDIEFSSWGSPNPAAGKVPTRSILKSVSSYDTPLETPDAVWTRVRSNSSDQQMHNPTLASPQPNALTRVPSGDKENIDGLPSPSKTPLSSPPFAYEDPLAPGYSPFENKTHDDEITPAEKRMSFPYANPAHNSSAPALSQFSGPGGSLSHRAMTAPLGKKKELVWAPNCAVYHTFHGSEYDRRSEIATCNRLTPQLAQEIKAFLNQYKLEEMAVHPDSRINTQFFG